MTESSKGGGLGVSISAHAPITVEGSLYAGKGKEKDTSVSYKESTIQARNELISHSGKDTNLIGSTLSGGKVTMNIGGNMNITSRQVSHHYTSENASAGMHVSTLPGKVNLTGNASRGRYPLEKDLLSYDVRKYVLFGMRGPRVCAFLFVKSREAHVRNENDVRAWEKIRQPLYFFSLS